MAFNNIGSDIAEAIRRLLLKVELIGEQRNLLQGSSTLSNMLSGIAYMVTQRFPMGSPVTAYLGSRHISVAKSVAKDGVYVDFAIRFRRSGGLTEAGDLLLRIDFTAERNPKFIIQMDVQSSDVKGFESIYSKEFNSVEEFMNQGLSLFDKNGFGKY